MQNEQSIEEPFRIRKFEVGDFVFAKLKGYPPWPAKIDQIESIISGGKEKTRYNVFFFGTHQASNLRESSLFHYYTYAKQIVEKWGRKPKFHDALKELEREMMDKVTYIHQLRAPTEAPWCNGFSNACEDLAKEINGAKQKTTSKNHKRSDVVGETDNTMEDHIVDESRRLGYEVMYVQRIPFPDTPEHLIVLSLSYNKEWVEEEAKRIKNEERMMDCYVRIEPFPPEYAHLDPDRALKQVSMEAVVKESPQKTESLKSPGKSFQSNGDVMPIVHKVEIQTPEKINSDVYQDLSSDEEIIETCPVCRLCFFSLVDLRNHEKTVHGTVSTAESLFDNLVS